MNDFIRTLLTAAVTGVVTGLISIYVLGTIKRGIDAKVEATREELKRQRAFARRRAGIDGKRKSAEAKLFFYLARDHLPTDTDGVEAAWDNYNAVDAEDKALDAEILAEYETDH